MYLAPSRRADCDNGAILYSSMIWITRAPHGRRRTPAPMLWVGQGSTSTRKGVAVRFDIH